VGRLGLDRVEQPPRFRPHQTEDRLRRRIARRGGMQRIRPHFLFLVGDPNDALLRYVPRWGTTPERETGFVDVGQNGHAHRQYGFLLKSCWTQGWPSQGFFMQIRSLLIAISLVLSMVLPLILRLVLALWLLSAFFRIAWVMPSPAGELILGVFVILVLSFIVWGVVRKVRTGKLPSKEEEQAVVSKVGGRVWSMLGAGFGAACIASFILLVEFNDTFSRQSVERLTGEHSVTFWTVVGAAAFAGAIERLWAPRIPGKPRGGGETAHREEGGSPGAQGLTNG
jgi:hypothetical protein